MKTVGSICSVLVGYVCCGWGQFEQIQEDLPSMFKLQNYAIPHDKLREYIRHVGAKIKPIILPNLHLLLRRKKKKKSKIKVLTLF